MFDDVEWFLGGFDWFFVIVDGFRGFANSEIPFKKFQHRKC